MAEERIRLVRRIADDCLATMTDRAEWRTAIGHLDGVALLASMLAVQRGVDAELAAVSGHLHDLHAYATGIRALHAVSGAEMVRPILRDSGLFTNDDVRQVVVAIFHHSDKAGRHDPLSEVLKDADVLQHYLRDPGDAVSLDEAARLAQMAGAFGLAPTWRVAPTAPRTQTPEGPPLAERVAQAAERLVAAGIEGVLGDDRYRAICRPFTAGRDPDELSGRWCAAFVYECCRCAGLALPIRHPGASCRFCAVLAWLEWARIQAVLHLGPVAEIGRGDLVVYDDLLGGGPHDHIGVVLAVSADTLRVAEGNANGSNRGAIVTRSGRRQVHGVIRLAGACAYAWSGEPDWAV